MFGLMVIKPTPCDQSNYSELYMFGLMVRLIYTCLDCLDIEALLGLRILESYQDEYPAW